ncbi:hypothetical protein NDU88_001742 [Pleurodeles waltl]|uniref:Uncharacterized protein n=1 Tax=Pleurodeles waltl TaxID=8319 RepID=A0AAV7P6E0_PLEWA|nr:hypothetical protein NDU88_001742 [Pleurodeles waltl]
MPEQGAPTRAWRIDPGGHPRTGRPNLKRGATGPGATLRAASRRTCPGLTGEAAERPAPRVGHETTGRAEGASWRAALGEGDPPRVRVRAGRGRRKESGGRGGRCTLVSGAGALLSGPSRPCGEPDRGTHAGVEEPLPPPDSNMKDYQEHSPNIRVKFGHRSGSPRPFSACCRALSPPLPSGQRVEPALFSLARAGPEENRTGDRGLGWRSPSPARLQYEGS